MPPSPSPVGRARPVVQQATPGSVVKTSEVDKIAAEAQESNIIRRRKYIVWAVGAAVFTVACTFLGARLKEFKQESDRMEGIEAAAKELRAGVVVGEEQILQTEPADSRRLEEVEKQNNTETVGMSPLAESTQNSPYSIDIARQVALLEDRKALLNRHKMTLESKIQMLRERQARKAEIDARRPTQGNG